MLHSPPKTVPHSSLPSVRRGSRSAPAMRASMLAGVLILAQLVVPPTLSAQSSATADVVAAQLTLQAGDLAGAIPLLERSARAGNRLAQYQYARILLEATEPPALREAWQWLRRASIAGLADAQFAFAALYEHGELVPRSEATAREWYRRAAEQGHVEAQYALARLLMHGRGVQPNPRLAARWLRAAALAGHSGAQQELVRLHETGGAAERDSEHTSRWQATAESGER